MTSTGTLDLAAGYTPLPAQEKFHQSPAKFRLYSGGFGSGKSVCGCREAILTAWMYPGSLGAISRLRAKDLELTTQRTFWEELAKMGLDKKPYLKNFSARTQMVTFGNGSEVAFTGLDDEMKLRSLNMDWWYIDEGSEVPDNIYRTVISRLRGRTGPRRLWVTTNPGASGWLRRNFIDRRRMNEKYWSIVAPTRENIHLPEGYVESMLEEYPEAFRKRYLDGNWDAFEGQVFTGFDEAKHLIDDADWRVPEGWQVIEGWDFGFRNPTHVVWIAWDGEDEYPLVVFDELVMQERTPDYIGRHVHQRRAKYGISDRVVAYGDPAGAGVQGLKGESYFDAYGAMGIGISPSVKSPSIRAVRIARRINRELATRHGIMPGIVFVKQKVPHTLRSLVAYRYKENRSLLHEDPKEEFHKEDDHGVDALGYGMAGVNSPDDADDAEGHAFPFRAARPFSTVEEWDGEEDDGDVLMYG